MRYDKFLKFLDLEGLEAEMGPELVRRAGRNTSVAHKSMDTRTYHHQRVRYHN